MAAKAKKVVFKVNKRFVLNGTIDGHNPVGVRFKVRGPEGVFFLTVITVNWGRGYSPTEFKKNVLQVLNRFNRWWKRLRRKRPEFVVLLMQEIDEADRADEHGHIESIMVPGTTLVQWATREPIAVSPKVRVWRSRKTMTMDQGINIGAPAGTGPRRYFTSCLTEIMGVVIGFGNQHPHRDLRNAKVQQARARGIQITRHEVGELLQLADVVVHGGDMNDVNYPKAWPTEKVGNEQGMDTVRFIVKI